MLTLSDFFEQVYLQHHLDVQPSSAEQFRVAIRLMNRAVGHTVMVSELSESLLFRMAHWLRTNGRSPGTINSRVKTIMSLWREAVRSDMSPPLPARVPRVRVPKRLPQAWYLGEVGKLIQVCRQLPGHMHKTAIPKRVWWSSQILFLYDTGARIGASLAVSPHEIDLDRRVARLSVDAAKTGYEQLVSISNETADAIAEQLEYSRAYPRVWPYLARRESLFVGLKSILRRAGLPDDRASMFHRMRRTNATWSAKHGSIEMAQKQLGHRSPQMTIERYLDPRIVRVVQAAEVLPRPVCQ